MNLENTIALIVAAGSLITAIWAGLNSWATNKNSATRQELESLRATIKTLQDENGRLQNRVKELEQRNAAQDAASMCLEDKVKLLEDDKSSMTREIQALNSENAALRKRIDKLEKTLREHNIVPPPDTGALRL